MKILIAVVAVIIILSIMLIMFKGPTDKSISITTSNNVFAYFYLNTRLHSVAITPGIYSPSKLATTMTEQLSDEEPGWTVLWNPDQKTFTFQNTLFRWDRCSVDNDISFAVGLPGDQACSRNWKTKETGNPI